MKCKMCNGELEFIKEIKNADYREEMEGKGINNISKQIKDFEKLGMINPKISFKQYKCKKCVLFCLIDINLKFEKSFGR